MPKTARFAEDVLSLMTGGEVEWKPNGVVYGSLLTAIPSLDGDQTSNEVSYPGYRRIEIDAGAWAAVEAGKWALAPEFRWPKAEDSMGNVETARFIGLGLSTSGPGYLAVYMPLDAEIEIKRNVIPAIMAGEMKISEK